MKARLTIVCAMTALLAACSTTQEAPAPVESRSPAGTTPTPAAVPSQARPGYYVVKRGDTLYSIALENGQDYRDVAAWNKLDNPNLILVGQELRVRAPEADVVASAEVSPTVEARPIDMGPRRIEAPVSAAPVPIAPPTPSPAGGAAVKQEPRGGRIAYSEEAWKNLQAQPAVPPAASSAPVAAGTSAPAAAVSAPATAPRPAASAPVETPKAAAANDAGMEWAWPAAGKVLASFNDSTNKGLDIGGTLGEPIFAAGSGRVVYVGSGLRGYGNLVIIKHDGNYLSAYAHNSEIYVKEQQQVQKGQRIAALGSSDSDRPKLHFEIRREGKPVDPMKYLPAR
ncbi:peptidoglycan DD-metalloendopeptidase family protein [Uliginosibacterium sp. H1]|uniref:peptidoglycan DD-metalloendopeptidase family protein n=1 Tax=Uliginosibacterium sp. H1 TaxID=3114757 RepID=UPI002E17B247|nr:peptidoglycan DD-metalloendopeptidase family protein [Uliginosibacterium sp. H1]